MSYESDVMDFSNRCETEGKAPETIKNNIISLKKGNDTIKQADKDEIKRLLKQNSGAISGDSFIKLQIPDREMLINPIIPASSIINIIGERGSLKSMLSLHLANCILNKTKFLKWETLKSKKVALFDGETPQKLLQDRIKQQIQGNLQNLKVFSKDMMLAYEAGNLIINQDKYFDDIVEKCEGSDVIIFDNESTLCEGLKELFDDSYEPIIRLLMKLRSQGKSIIYCGHRGKDKEKKTARGSSKKEDIADTIFCLSLNDKKKYSETRVNLEITKKRHFWGEDAKPIEIILKDNVWSYKESDNEDIQGNFNHQIAEFISKHEGLGTNELIEEINLKLNIPVRDAREILKDGVDIFWKTEKQKANRIAYFSIKNQDQDLETEWEKLPN